MTTAEQRIPLLPSPPGSVLKPVGNQMHPGDDSILAGSLSSNSKIVLQPSVPESWACMAQVAASTRFAYDTFFQNGVGAYGRYVERYQPFDVSVLAGSRRKNATRETTSTLKAWLHEHRKNPYPTKGEKIMLAILTKMTLTQVSTWFANARRRLKKENKMTWLPRNKSGVKESDKASPGAHSGSDDINTDSEDNDSDFESDDERAAGNDNTDLSADHVSAFQKAELVIKRLEHDKSDTPNVMSGGNESIKKESTSSDTKPLNNIIWNFETEKINQTETGPSTIGNSPVNSLQRWVNVCFETQSPVDFPKELTPPHTPVEINKQAATFISSMRSPLQEERSAVAPKMDHLNNTFSRFDAGTKLPESSETTLTLSSLARITETRPCILTSHRELDAVLALTSLASR